MITICSSESAVSAVNETDPKNKTDTRYAGLHNKTKFLRSVPPNQQILRFYRSIGTEKGQGSDGHATLNGLTVCFEIEYN